VILSVDISGDAKVGEVHAPRVEEDIRRLEVQMTNVRLVAIGHCPSYTSYDLLKVFQGTAVLSRGGACRASSTLNGAKVFQVQSMQPTDDILAVAMARP
jgi:hypothetical protein